MREELSVTCVFLWISSVEVLSTEAFTITLVNGLPAWLISQCSFCVLGRTLSGSTKIQLHISVWFAKYCYRIKRSEHSLWHGGGTRTHDYAAYFLGETVVGKLKRYCNIQRICFYISKGSWRDEKLNDMLLYMIFMLVCTVCKDCWGKWIWFDLSAKLNSAKQTDSKMWVRWRW